MTGVTVSGKSVQVAASLFPYAWWEGESVCERQGPTPNQCHQGVEGRVKVMVHLPVPDVRCERTTCLMTPWWLSLPSLSLPPSIHPSLSEWKASVDDTLEEEHLMALMWGQGASQGVVGQHQCISWRWLCCRSYQRVFPFDGVRQQCLPSFTPATKLLAIHE